MALLKCPECNGKISEFAEACPHCGCPITYIKSLLDQKHNISRDIVQSPQKLETEGPKETESNYFQISETGSSCTIDKYVGPNAGQVIIPIRINGLTVTRIAYNAFRGFDGLSLIVIPQDVKRIGDNAFTGCTGLTDISIANPNVEIGAYAFLDCSQVVIHAPVGSETEWRAKKVLQMQENLFSISLF